MLINANAKINVGLNVVSKRQDGYHNLETVFFPVLGLCDKLQITARNDKRIQLTPLNLDKPCADQDNLIYRVALEMQRQFDIQGVDIQYEKHIPTGAGLGGGSSDAAATAKAINKLFGLNLSKTELKNIVSRFGADCAFFIENTPCYATGKGEILTPIDLNLNDWHLVIAKPQVSVSTAQAYSRIRQQLPKENVCEILSQDVSSWQGRLRNDFEDSVFPLFPTIEKTKQTMYDLGASFALMTGSGASVFALFKHLPENLNDTLLSIDNKMFIFS